MSAAVAVRTATTLDMIRQAAECVDAATGSAGRREYESVLDELLAARLLLSTLVESLEGTPEQ